MLGDYVKKQCVEEMRYVNIIMTSNVICMTYKTLIIEQPIYLDTNFIGLVINTKFLVISVLLLV
jgi:hypothetical protein